MLYLCYLETEFFEIPRLQNAYKHKLVINVIEINIVITFYNNDYLNVLYIMAYTHICLLFFSKRFGLVTVKKDTPSNNT